MRQFRRCVLNPHGGLPTVESSVTFSKKGALWELVVEVNQERFVSESTSRASARRAETSVVGRKDQEEHLQPWTSRREHTFGGR